MENFQPAAMEGKDFQIILHPCDEKIKIKSESTDVNVHRLTGLREGFDFYIKPEPQEFQSGSTNFFPGIGQNYGQITFGNQYQLEGLIKSAAPAPVDYQPVTEAFTFYSNVNPIEEPVVIKVERIDDVSVVSGGVVQLEDPLAIHPNPINYLKCSFCSAIFVHSRDLWNHEVNIHHDYTSGGQSQGQGRPQEINIRSGKCLTRKGKRRRGQRPVQDRDTDPSFYDCPICDKVVHIGQIYKHWADVHELPLILRRQMYPVYLRTQGEDTYNMKPDSELSVKVDKLKEEWYSSEVASNRDPLPLLKVNDKCQGQRRLPTTSTPYTCPICDKVFPSRRIHHHWKDIHILPLTLRYQMYPAYLRTDGDTNVKADSELSAKVDKLKEEWFSQVLGDPPNFPDNHSSSSLRMTDKGRGQELHRRALYYYTCPICDHLFPTSGIYQHWADVHELPLILRRQMYPVYNCVQYQDTSVKPDSELKVQVEKLKEEWFAKLTPRVTSIRSIERID